MITHDNIIIIKFSIFFKFNFDSTKLIKKSIKKKLDFYKKYKELNECLAANIKSSKKTYLKCLLYHL